MSIATMNWALQQRLESPLQQILLYVIADSASPDGVTRHCDPEYLVKRARMSRATVFRKLSDLQRLGLVETFKGHGERGEHIYELRLDLAKFIDVPLRSQRQNRDDDDGGPENTAESHSETEAETGQESHSETQGESQPETHAVAPVRPVQSHSCDRISPPSSKQDSPPKPPPGVSDQKSDQGQGKEEAKQESEHFAPFFEACQHWRTMDRARALTAFGFLTLDEQGRARAASLLHAEECTKAKRRSKDAHKLLGERFWERYPNARLPEKAADPVWIDEGPDIDALRVLALIGDRAPPRLTHDDVKGTGLMRAGPLTPDLQALSCFIGSDILDWFVAEPDTREYHSWRRRLHDWTGQWAEPRIVMRRGKKIMQMLPGRPPIEVQNRQNGIPVPCRWPPKKDGKFYSDNSGEGETAA